MYLIGFTLHTIGEIFIALTVLLVHHQVLHEKKIDMKVIRGMGIEQKLGIIGVLCIVIGYFLQVYFL